VTPRLYGMMGLIGKNRKHRFQALQPSISSSVNCGHMAANQSARHTTKFVNIGRNMVVASKSGSFETGPTILLAKSLHPKTQSPFYLYATLCMYKCILVFFHS